jgi:hypothetical protein
MWDKVVVTLTMKGFIMSFNMHCVDAYNYHRWSRLAELSRAARLRRSMKKSNYSDRACRTYGKYVLDSSVKATNHYIAMLKLRNYRARAEYWYRGWYKGFGSVFAK